MEHECASAMDPWVYHSLHPAGVTASPGDLYPSPSEMRVAEHGQGESITPVLDRFINIGLLETDRVPG